MINLRYHIVSLTAVFLAIGIGLTLGSTFLDRATVENLNGQLESLESRLGERDDQISELEDARDRDQALQEALDEQGGALLAGRLDPVPVVVVASDGADADQIDGTVRSLQVAGADVQGLWWLSDRFLLGDDGAVQDLAAALDESSTDPARLRRVAVAVLGNVLRERQAMSATTVDDDDDAEVGDDPISAPDDPGTAEDGDDPLAPEADDPLAPEGDDAGPDDGAAPMGPLATADDEDLAADLGDAQGLFDAGFVVFQPVPDGPEAAQLPPGVRVVVIGGSPQLPDDVVVQPLVGRIADRAESPTRTVVASTLGEDAEVSEVVAAIRDDDRLRAVITTIDDLAHFSGWMAAVLAVEDVGAGIIGHYGLGEGASALLPPLQEP